MSALRARFNTNDLRVADPRQVTFFCSGQKKVTQEKAAPDGALFPALRAFARSLAHGTSLYRGRGAESFRAPTGSWAKAFDARGRHTGLNSKPHQRNMSESIDGIRPPAAFSGKHSRLSNALLAITK